MPARAAYAAAEADVLPVEAQIATFAPRSTAVEIAIVMPRSLNDPVGLSPSTLSSTRATPARWAIRGASSSGVLPSSRVITGVASVTGRNSRYASMSPGHADTVTPSLLFTHDPQHRADPVHLVDALERAARSRADRLPAPCGSRR